MRFPEPRSSLADQGQDADSDPSRPQIAHKPAQVPVVPRLTVKGANARIARFDAQAEVAKVELAKLSRASGLGRGGEKSSTNRWILRDEVGLPLSRRMGHSPWGRSGSSGPRSQALDHLVGRTAEHVAAGKEGDPRLKQPVSHQPGDLLDVVLELGRAVVPAFTGPWPKLTSPRVA